jgi:hypothetical protein
MPKREFPKVLARTILKLDFDENEKARMHKLAVKNQKGTISPQELEELDTLLKQATCWR